MSKYNWALLIAIREMFGNQQRFAKAMGTNESLVSRAIRNQSIPDELEIKWAKTLGKTREELFK